MSGWRFFCPIRSYFLWEYRRESPPEVDILLLDKTFELNEAESFIWESIDGDRRLHHIVELTHDRYPDVASARITRDVVRFVMFCHGEKLVYLHWEPLR